MVATIGIDLGGSKLSGGVVDEDGALLASHRYPSAVGDYNSAITAVADLVAELQDEIGVQAEAVGLAVAAFLDESRGRVRQAANLGWRDRQLSRDLGQRLDLPITTANDADAAAWGEYIHGSGGDRSSMVLITLGTGVGGGVIIDGNLVTGARGLGGEIGHLCVASNGRRCVCGARGCLEQYASATALVSSAQDQARARPRAAARLLALAHGDIDSVQGEHVVAAAQDGDAVALGALREVARWLGLGVAHVVAILDPAVVLIGGGLSAAGDLLLEHAREAFGETVGVPELRSQGVLGIAGLGPDAGIVGAAALARSHGRRRDVETPGQAQASRPVVGPRDPL